MLIRIIILILAVFSSTHLLAQGFEIGLAKRSITPSKKELLSKKIFLGGFGIYKKRGPANSIRGDIYCQAMAIRHQDKIIVITSLDLPGMSNKLFSEIRNRVFKHTAIPVENQFIGLTHTHAGPDLMGLWGGVSDSYKNVVVKQTTSAIIEAVNALQPAELYISKTKHPSKNRRGLQKTDTTVHVIDAHDKRTHKRLGTLINFATHPVFHHDNAVSGDFCSILSKNLSKHLHAPVLYMNGILGDVVPPDTVDTAQSLAKTLTQEVLLSMINQTRIEPGIVVKTATWRQEISNPLFIASSLIGLLDYELDFDLQHGLSVETTASYFRLGRQVQGVTFPGESLTENGLAIKDKMKTQHRLFFGLTGDSLGYFVDSRDWNYPQDHYEETLSMSKTAGDTARQQLSQLITQDNQRF